MEIEAKYKDLPQTSTHTEEGRARLIIEGNRSIVMAIFQLISSVNVQLKEEGHD